MALKVDEFARTKWRVSNAMPKKERFCFVEVGFEVLFFVEAVDDVACAGGFFVCYAELADRLRFRVGAVVVYDDDWCFGFADSFS